MIRIIFRIFNQNAKHYRLLNKMPQPSISSFFQKTTSTPPFPKSNLTTKKKDEDKEEIKNVKKNDNKSKKVGKAKAEKTMKVEPKKFETKKIEKAKIEKIQTIEESLSSNESEDETQEIIESSPESSPVKRKPSRLGEKPKRRLAIVSSSEDESKSEEKEPTPEPQPKKRKTKQKKIKDSSDEEKSPLKKKASSDEKKSLLKKKKKTKDSSDDDEDESELSEPEEKEPTFEPQPKKRKTKEKKIKDSSDEEKSPLKKKKKTDDSPKEASSSKIKVEDSPKKDNGAKATPKKEKDVDNSPKKEKETNGVEKNNGFFSKSSAKSPENGSSSTAKKWDNDYDPKKDKYDPIADASWERGQKVPYLALAKTLEAIEGTSSRLKIIETLANYFRSVMILSPNDLLYSCYLCLNKLAPAYEGIELGIAETNIMKAIAQATGRSFQSIKADAGSLGDLGLVAENSRSNQRTLFQPAPLTLNGVFHKLKEIGKLTGQASHGKKISMIQGMLVSCKHSEARYLARSLVGKLRIGLAEQSLLQAIGQAVFLTPPNQDLTSWPPKILNAGKKMNAEALKAKIDETAYLIKSCYCECPNYDILIEALLTSGLDGLNEKCKLTPGIPPRPMLAQPTKGVADVLQRFDDIKFTCEYKYDGERAQIHLLEGGKIHIYSRNQENNTSKYPDIISRFDKCIIGDVKSCILDSEAVAWDIENKAILPFQVLSTRKRKDANEDEIKVQVFIFAFDLIYFNGRNLIKEPLSERRRLLRENFQEVEGQFGFATSLDTSSMEDVQEFLEESIKGNCEGLMVKTLDVNASYELAKRSQKWLKLKKDYLDSGGDSLDLVVIGGFLGKGKRTGNYGGFLLACYDPDNEEYQTICKIGTGFSDEQLVKHSESLKPNLIKEPKPYYRYHNNLTPDHWFDAAEVWEVKCADLSLSPVHTAGRGIIDPERGISLRFPRFLRLREDKNAEDATSSSQVADMYNNQDQVKNAKGNTNKDDDDEFY